MLLNDWSVYSFFDQLQCKLQDYLLNLGQYLTIQKALFFIEFHL
jgi:hypothetical protein